jgi:hypothetical protein
MRKIKRGWALTKKSWGLRDRWGQQIAGNIAIGVIGLAISALIGKALSGIFGVALYRYALDGETVGGFTPDELESAVKPKGARNAPPTATTV